MVFRSVPIVKRNMPGGCWPAALLASFILGACAAPGSSSAPASAPEQSSVSTPISLVAPGGPSPAVELVTPFRATGNEPFWAIDYDGTRIALTEPGRDTRYVEVERRQHAGGWLLQSADSRLHIDIQPRICQDSMSGLVRPYSVSLHMNESVVNGCGGDPLQLLQGVRWQLKSAGDLALTVPAWLEFLPDNRLAGSNGCNRLMGSYRITGEGMQFSQLGSTRMACPADIMQQADRVDRYLAAVHGFGFDPAGTLILQTPQGALRLLAAGSEK